MEWEIIAGSNKKRSIQHYSWIQTWATGGTRCFKAYRVSVHFSHALFFKNHYSIDISDYGSSPYVPDPTNMILWTPQMTVSTSCEEATDALLLFTEISQESQNQPTLLWNPVSPCHWNIIEVYGFVIVILYLMVFMVHCLLQLVPVLLSRRRWTVLRYLWCLPPAPVPFESFLFYFLDNFLWVFEGACSTPWNMQHIFDCYRGKSGFLLRQYCFVAVLMRVHARAQLS